MHETVKRIACAIVPAFTSSHRTSPARIGSPAASAEVHVSGRSAFESRSQIAPLPASGSPPFQSAAYSSYSRQVPRCTISACRSEPPSIGVPESNG